MRLCLIGVAYIIVNAFIATMSVMETVIILRDIMKTMTTMTTMTTVSTQKNIMKEMNNMAYKAREEQKLIGIVPKGSMVIKVQRIIPEDKTKLESVDVRLNYMGPNGEWLPTQKGIRVNSEEFPQLMKVLLDAMTTEEYQDLENLGYYVGEEEEEDDVE
jgi:hypothetical protein